jgi:amino acid transporter
MIKIKQTQQIALIAVVILGIATTLNIEATVVGPLINFKYLIALPVLFIGFVRPMVITLRTFMQNYSESGGSYIWISSVLGKKFAFFISVMQWYAVLIWFPSITILVAQVLTQSLKIHVEHYQLLGFLIYLVGVGLNLSGVKFFHNLAAKLSLLMFFIPFTVIFGIWFNHLLLNPSSYYHIMLANMNYHFDLNLLLLLYGSVCGGEVIFTHFEEIKSNPTKLSSMIYLLNCLIPILYGGIGVILAYPFLLTHQVISDNILVIINTFFTYYHYEYLIRPSLFLFTFAGILSFAPWMLSASRVVQIGSNNLKLSIIWRC